jgi:IclR family acetate operon transcriptional repressor
MLAWLPEGEIKRVLAHGMTRYTANTITEWPALIEELRHVRRNGYSMDREEYQPGVICVGAAIRDHNGAVVGAISASTPAMRASDEHLALVREQVTGAVRALSAELGAQAFPNRAPVAAE